MHHPSHRIFDYLLVLLLSPSLVLLPHHAQAASPESRTYKIVDGRELKLHLFQPAGRVGDRVPCIVFYHGGGWVGGSPSQFDWLSDYLASRGMVGITVEYRLLKRSPADLPLVCIQDAKSALRWVRAHAAELGIDPDRIAAGGGSAGGHLAAAVALLDGMNDPQDDLGIPCRPNVLVLFNPVLDNGPEGWGQNRVGDRYPEFSPAHNIRTGAPPTLVLSGEGDKLITVARLRKFADGMKTVGSACTLKIYDGQDHGFFNRDPFRTLTAIEADKFLVSLGWLKGSPTLKALDQPEPKRSAK